VPADRIDRALAAVVKALTESHGPGTVARLDAPAAYEEVKYVIPTGIAGLDRVFGVGGLPLGRLIEIYGAEHSLKSTVSKWLVAVAQKHGAVGKLIDAELSGAAEFDKQLGVQVDRTLVSQPDTLEEVFEIMLEGMNVLLRYKVPALYVFDSLAAAKLKEELEGAVDDDQAPALRARFLGKNIPKILDLLKKSDGLFGVVFVNQLREKIGASKFQKQTYAPGGRTIRHFYHVRIESTPFGMIKGPGDEPAGLRARFKAIKNKLAPPFQEVVLEYYFAPPLLVEEGKGPSRKRPVLAVTAPAAQEL